MSLPAEGIKPESVSVRQVFDRLSPLIERPPLRGAWGSALTRAADHFSRSLDLPLRENGRPAATLRACVNVASTNRTAAASASQALPALARFLYTSRYLLCSNAPGAGVRRSQRTGFFKSISPRRPLPLSDYRPLRKALAPRLCPCRRPSIPALRDKSSRHGNPGPGR